MSVQVYHVVLSHVQRAILFVRLFFFFIFCIFLYFFFFVIFFFQAEDGIRDLVRSRGLGDVYKRQCLSCVDLLLRKLNTRNLGLACGIIGHTRLLKSILSTTQICLCLLYTSDAADERSSVDLGGRRLIKKQTIRKHMERRHTENNETE